MTDQDDELQLSSFQRKCIKTTIEWLGKESLNSNNKNTEEAEKPEKSRHKYSFTQMSQEELTYYRAQVVDRLKSIQELLKNNNEQYNPSLVRNIIETIRMAYSCLLPLKNEHKEDDERVRFLVEEMDYYLKQL